MRKPSKATCRPLASDEGGEGSLMGTRKDYPRNVGRMPAKCHNWRRRHLRRYPATAMEEQQTGELPTEKAFVVQLRRDTGPSLEPFAGRVEHLASGRRLRFD